MKVTNDLPTEETVSAPQLPGALCTGIRVSRGQPGVNPELAWLHFNLMYIYIYIYNSADASPSSSLRCKAVVCIS